MTVVYTIGYEGTDIERFVETLKAVGIQVLADVRAVAISRKKGFSKKALKARLELEGISYLHFDALGDPKSGREAARAGRYEEFRRVYGKHISGNEAQQALQALENVIRDAPSCLLCFERDPSVCHRSIVASEMSLKGIRSFDLFGDDPTRYVDHARKRSRHHSRESAATA